MKAVATVWVLVLILPGLTAARELSTSLIPAPGLLGDDVPPRDYLFAFAAIGDSHIEPAGSVDFCYLKASHKSRHLLETYVADINSHIPPVDLAIHLGDITEFGTPMEFAMAKEILDDLDCPLYSVLGNHDDFQNDGKQAWREFAGMESTSYSFDFMNAHFVVVDCTLDPLVPPYVSCGPAIRQWVEADLASTYPRPSFVICHYNLWERPWNAKFDKTGHYEEYDGMAELRGVLERAGNVVAVINGHVHASRAELHNGIWYIDVGATLVGTPLIRYFYVCDDRVEITYRYISDNYLRGCVSRLCYKCSCCFDREAVRDFIVGEESDKFFTMTFNIASLPGPNAGAETPGAAGSCMQIRQGPHGQLFVETGGPGLLRLSLYDVLGRNLDAHTVRVEGKGVSVSVPDCFPSLSRIPYGVYFLRASANGKSAAARFSLPLNR
jgi:predicted phosphodiesterase